VNDQDPWKRKRNPGPPDLETIIKNLFKNKKNYSGTSGTSGPSTPFLWATPFIFIAFYILSGFYIVREPEQAVVTRFGKLHEVKYSGLNWHPRFIDSVYIIDISAIESFKKENVMLTEDENIINAGFEIQYRKNNPESFLFNDENPIFTLHQLTESAIREVIGHSKLDEILTVGKQDITRKIHKLIEQSLISYNLGIELIDVNLGFALPPVAVQQAFNDVIKAREDEQAYQNEAERYKENKLPIALGDAQRITYEADAYKKERLLKAQAHTQSFEILEQQYRINPKLMKARLYYETIEQVLSSTTKIIVDPELGNHLLFLNPLLGESEQNKITPPQIIVDSSDSKPSKTIAKKYHAPTIARKD
jgi:membrane protease subunit HflK